MADVHKISEYTPKFTDTFFLDTNVWIYLFCPIANNRAKEQKVYSAFYKLLIQGNKGIFVNSLVLSEFANTWLRIDFNLWKKEDQKLNTDYKRDFVGTDRFKETVDDIKQAIKVILSKAERMTDNFNSISLDKVFGEFGTSDFNDAYYLELARMNNWKIVTHDSDFFKENKLSVDIITAKV
ncbi:MAG: PIN domain-containing protein [Cyclobacteriaceae bacterium]